MSHRLASAQTGMGGNAVKRQRIRKGTFSCWECKRRKTKCEFKPATGTLCLSCQRRGTSCIGQEYAESSEPSSAEVEQRIDHVESLVNRLVQQRGSQSVRYSELAIDTGIESTDLQDRTPRQTTVSDTENTNNWPLPPTSLIHAELSPESHSLKLNLLTALPNPPKVAQIFTRGKFFSLPIHVRWQPTSTAMSAITDGEQLAQVSALPSPTAHPVHFARKLIQLALCLHQLDLPDYDAARHYMNVAIRNVTSQDSLMESMDGIEALMLESCYHINVGNIRHAWLAVRRALAIAQLIGLPWLAQQINRREDNVWFRLVLADRCLSWMLGLPIGVTDDSFATENRRPTDTWTARIQRCHAVVCGRIITRNLDMQRRRRRSVDSEEPGLVDDFQATQNIDLDLKREARCLPRDWWLRPRLNRTTPTETLEATGRLIAQMHHNFLLIILHQPYVIFGLTSYSSPAKTMNNHVPFNLTYSQSVVYSASCQVLEGFLLLRSSHRTLSYRGVDDKVFVAVMMFFLIHIQGHALETANALEHQRPHDLAVVRETISILEETSLVNNDTLSAAAAKVLRKLADVEAHSANDARYEIWMEEALAGITNYEFHESNNQLKLPVSYFGFVHVALAESESPRFAANTRSDVVDIADHAVDKPSVQRYTETDVLSRVSDSIPTSSAVDFHPQQAIPVADIDDFHFLLDLPSALSSDIPEPPRSPNQELLW